MAQTLTSLLVHIVFSTKHRVPIITPEVEPDLFAYMGGILKNNSCTLLAAGGTSDHVHLLISQSKNIALSVLLAGCKERQFFVDQDEMGSLQRLSLAWDRVRRAIPLELKLFDP